jgi:hypothetical protein
MFGYYHTMIYNAETLDPLNQYNTTTGEFIAANSGFYQFYSSGVTQYISNIVLPVANASQSSFIFGAVIVQYRGATSISQSYITNSTGALNNASMPIGTVLKTFTYQGFTPQLYLLAGDKVVVLIEDPYGTNTPYTPGDVTRTVSANSIFLNEITNPVILDGSTMPMNSTVPIDIKQSDFLMSIIRMFNLFVETDKNDSNNLIIDTYDAFYGTGTTQDWSKLLDVSKPVTITPMGALDARRYTLKYTQDTDYWNKFYFEKYSKTYGEYNLDITNDFLKNENKNEVLFAPTPSIGTTAVDRIIPEIKATLI